MEQNEILISEGNRPWWQRIIAAAAFTGMFVFLYYFIITFNIFDSDERIRDSSRFLIMAIYLCSFGIGFSIVRDYHFDFKTHRYKNVFRVGPVKIGGWRKFKNLEYVSAFKNSRNIFELNLWYNRNKHFNLFSYDNAEDALYAGKQLAEKLDIDLLDATFPHNSKWVDKNP